MGEKKCIICGKDHYAKSYCRNHYELWRRTGSPHSKISKNKGLKCKVKGCSKNAYIKGVCMMHYIRWRAHGSYDKKIYKGPNHWRWKGGKSEYPDHYILKKNRLAKLKETGNKCENCGSFADRVIRKDGSKSNHAVENLKAVCRKCFGENVRLHGKSKYKSKYGSVKDLAEKCGVSEATMYQRLRKGLPPGGAGSRRGRPEKSA